MLLVFAKDNNRLVCKDFLSNKVLTVSYSDILNGTCKVDNLHVVNGKVQGRKFNMDKLSEFKSSIGRSYVYKLLMKNDESNILGYFAITNKGEDIYVEKDNIVKDFRHGVVNGEVKNNVLSIKNIDALERINKIKSISYDSNDYYEMYKLYSNRGLIGHSVKIDHVGLDVSEKSNGELQFKDVSHSKSSTLNFMESHKILYGILLKANITRFVRIPDTFDIDIQNNKVTYNKETIDKKSFIYKISFIYRDYKMTLLIHNKDKRLLSVIKNRYNRLNKLEVSDIRELVEYTKEEKEAGYSKFESITTVLDKSNRSKVKLENIVTDGVTRVLFESNYLYSTYGNLDTKSSIKIGCDEIKNLEMIL